ncbi:MBL fold metallo-hydrolase [Rhizorhabdus dicambivorans]|uniref:MBL fold metallo-hydrolase n=1 Tax=Rhizorhabdus dicambivorans TaxID=1850238 RepID=A0A2A4FQ02_9SPHN|nr:MBL fold metallo-hydrolase [Rhizorhabdus dicambivorans]ATE64673.1 MBL fold metallo-hydrolase [Rhizorhabdus dicambivorans]PCE39794.1 MBL fold metallo-hydrolase [Rhizorhabdus dicambivorans]
MSAQTFSKGLHDLGNGSGAWAWLMPTGGWNQSNAGLITDGDEALLVDTLVDERLTAEMLDAMRSRTGFGADNIGTLVNTNENSNHSWGNRLLVNATIYASEPSALEMAEDTGPQQIGKLLGAAGGMGELGQWFLDRWGGHQFEGLEVRPPDRSFTGQLSLKVGDKDVHLIQVGPASTPGDVIVHSPADRVVFAGDALFVGNTPFTWNSSVTSWIAACDRIMALDADVIVPGHGPLTDKAGVKRMQDYLRFVDRETRRRHAAGMDSWQTAQEIAEELARGELGHWPDGGRLAITVGTIFREIEADDAPPNLIEFFSRAQQLDKKLAAN